MNSRTLVHRKELWLAVTVSVYLGLGQYRSSSVQQHLHHLLMTAPGSTVERSQTVLSEHSFLNIWSTTTYFNKRFSLFFAKLYLFTAISAGHFDLEPHSILTNTYACIPWSVHLSWLLSPTAAAPCCCFHVWTPRAVVWCHSAKTEKPQSSVSAWSGFIFITEHADISTTCVFTYPCFKVHSCPSVQQQSRYVDIAVMSSNMKRSEATLSHKQTEEGFIGKKEKSTHSHDVSKAWSHITHHTE